MHDRRIFVVDFHLVDFLIGVFVEPDPHVGLHILVQDPDIVVSIGQLVLVHKAERVPNLVQVQTFL